jgi:hypothetical protein
VLATTILIVIFLVALTSFILWNLFSKSIPKTREELDKERHDNQEWIIKNMRGSGYDPELLDLLEIDLHLGLQKRRGQFAPPPVQLRSRIECRVRLEGLGKNELRARLKREGRAHIEDERDAVLPVLLAFPCRSEPMPNAIDRQFDDVVRSISFCHTDLLSRELL